MSSEKVSFLLITEDSSAGTRVAMRLLVQQMCELIAGGARSRVNIIPHEEPALRGDRWRAHAPSGDLVNLRRHIARHVAEPNGYVLFHFDAEVVWPRNESAPPPPKAAADLDRLLNLVRQILVGGKLNPDLARKVIPIVPYFELESWLYQNTHKARGLIASCPAAEHRASRARVDDWERDRRLLDEIEAPKDQLCIKDRGNEELARGFPADEVLAVDASFARTVATLLDADGLARLLGPQVA